MMRNFFMLTILCGSLALTGCQNMNNVGTKQGVGAVGGAVLGGLAGSQVGDGSGQLVATGAGTLLGAFLGSEIGKSLDRADRLYAQQATERALGKPVGTSVSWNNPESGNRGTVTPVDDYKTQSGRYCQEYQQTIYINGKAETGYGTACKAPDGTWQIQN